MIYSFLGLRSVPEPETLVRRGRTGHPLKIAILLIVDRIVGVELIKRGHTHRVVVVTTHVERSEGFVARSDGRIVRIDQQACFNMLANSSNVHLFQSSRIFV